MVVQIWVDPSFGAAPSRRPRAVVAGRQEVTLHRILVHVVAETSRHAGQADIVRELIDGAAGLHPGDDHLRAQDRAWWRNHRDQLERVARHASQARALNPPNRSGGGG